MASHCLCVCEGKEVRQGEGKLMIHPSLSYLFVLYWEFNQNKQQTHLCQASVYRKTNITWFRRIMMPQRCLCSHIEQLGQHESSKCENSLTGTKVRPRLAASFPGERLSGKSTLPTAHQWSFRLEKHNCHCWRVIEKWGPVCICTAYWWIYSIVLSFIHNCNIM